ncbi:MAG: hypothetical protein JW775_10825 [Candidatus Aminicenantes bacterium]|nr:hypothetical protein [Candidatus Aminicenantes bacterium]
MSDGSIKGVTSATGEFAIRVTSMVSEHVRRGRRHSLKRLLGLVEKNVILDILRRVGGNQRDAGRILGVNPTTLNAKLKKYGIQVVKQIGDPSESVGLAPSGGPAEAEAAPGRPDARRIGLSASGAMDSRRD